MSLVPGARLGRYEITAELGRGGMGEVWRATDTKLGRDVALKVLPEDFAGDTERLARFEREAKVLASLNHPHIASIFGLEESDGVRALVMELVDGQGLDDPQVSQTSGTAMYAVSSRGTLACVAESEGNPLRELVWLDRSGGADLGRALRARHQWDRGRSRRALAGVQPHR